MAFPALRRANFQTLSVRRNDSDGEDVISLSFPKGGLPGALRWQLRFPGQIRAILEHRGTIVQNPELRAQSEATAAFLGDT